ncbi:MAG TPA: type IV pilus biogenesis/stability protein PilW [Burkholderiales bacterium]|nr:type IV pilus biogenesis/stability protein PilW [Burkholderiales bacterium]
MKIRSAILAAMLAGCAAQNQSPDPLLGSATMDGELGDKRNRARLHTELASLYFNNGNMTVALDELRAATAADPNYGPAYGMFGVLYMRLNETVRAEESFERSLRLAPNDPDVNHNYGWFLCQTGREQASIKHFENAVRNPLYPTPQRSYAAAGVCALKANQVKQAEGYFEQALKLEPDEPSSLLQLGQIRYRQGNIGEARKLVTRHNKLVTPSAESLWLAVRIERRLGERLQEQAYANQLRRRYPTSPEYQALLQGRYD